MSATAKPVVAGEVLWRRHRVDLMAVAPQTLEAAIG
jgi:hypothetical protein